MNRVRRAGSGGSGRFRRRLRLVAPLALGILVAGCAVSVDGTARPGANLTPRLLTGSTIQGVLLGDSALSRILNQSFMIDSRYPPRFGGPETLQDDGAASPGGCLGVAWMLQQDVYQPGEVRHVAVETWRNAATPVEVTSVKEAVVSLPTAADARALFAKFSEQWRTCDGTTSPLPGSMFRLPIRLSRQLFRQDLRRSARMRQPSRRGAPLASAGIASSRWRSTSSVRQARRVKGPAMSTLLP